MFEICFVFNNNKMSCVFIPPWFRGFASIIFIVFLTSLVSLFIILHGMKHYILNNWELYKCNPIFMPFVGFFGFDSMINLNECIGRTVKKQSTPLLSPYKDAVESIHSGISGFSSVVHQAQQIIDMNQVSMAQSMGSVLGRMGNVSASAQFLMINVKHIFQKIIAL
jgi:hypothetical protein